MCMYTVHNYGFLPTVPQSIASSVGVRPSTRHLNLKSLLSISSNPTTLAHVFCGLPKQTIQKIFGTTAPRSCPFFHLWPSHLLCHRFCWPESRAPPTQQAWGTLLIGIAVVSFHPSRCGLEYMHAARRSGCNQAAGPGI